MPSNWFRLPNGKAVRLGLPAIHRQTQSKRSVSRGFPISGSAERPFELELWSNTKPYFSPDIKACVSI